MTSHQKTKGLWFAIAAYLCWGFFPLFWKMLKEHSPWEILIHRIFWSFLFYFAVVYFQKKHQDFFRLCKQPKVLALTLASSILIAINWVVFIIAVNTGHTIESSLGYFINPILNIVLGLVFFKEKLSQRIWIAFGIVFLTVSWLVLQSEKLPWIALTLAITFALYGLIRKISKQDAILHSTLESGILVPAAIIAAPWLCQMNPLTAPIGDTSLLALGGILTGFVLWIFAIGAKSLDYSTMGFLQYIAPTLQFLTGVFIFNETLSRDRLIAFAFIWIAVGIVIWDLRTASAANQHK